MFKGGDKDKTGGDDGKGDGQPDVSKSLVASKTAKLSEVSPAAGAEAAATPTGTVLYEAGETDPKTVTQALLADHPDAKLDKSSGALTLPPVQVGSSVSSLRALAADVARSTGVSRVSFVTADDGWQLDGAINPTVNNLAGTANNDPLYLKLKALAGSIPKLKPDRAFQNIKNEAPELEAFIMGGQFEGCDGYKTVIGQMNVPSEAKGAVAVFKEAARLQGMDMTVQFEITEAGNDGKPKFDVDVAAIAPGTQVIHCYAVKRCGMKKLTDRLSEAARQLINYVPPSGWTTTRVVVVHVNDGTDDDYRAQKMQGTKDVIRNNTHINEFRIVLFSGTVVGAPGDL